MKQDDSAPGRSALHLDTRAVREALPRSAYG